MLISSECTSTFHTHETVTVLCNFCLCFSECRREDIKYENTGSVAKASYADGETMKVNCMTGYTGLYKLKCEKENGRNPLSDHVQVRTFLIFLNFWVIKSMLSSKLKLV